MMFISCLSMTVALCNFVGQDVLVKTSILTPTQVKAMTGDKSAVTKAELVVILTKLVSYLEASSKQKRGTSVKALPPKSVRDLIKSGYLPSDTPLASNPTAKVSRDELSAALASVLIRHNEKVVPITPDSRRATPIPHPSENSGS